MKEDILDKYALQILSDADKIWLQKALKADPSFQKELDLHLKIVRGIEMHTEKLFDVAFEELNAMAEESLKNNIDEVDLALKKEGFFEHIPATQLVVDKKPPLQEKEIKEKNTAIEQSKQVEKTTNKNIESQPKQEVNPITTQSYSNTTPTPEKTEDSNIPTPPKTDWVKIGAILLVIILTILLVWQQL